MFFFGWGTKTRPCGEVYFLCSRCDSLQRFRLVENFRYFHLYLIRIAKYNVRRLILCTHCQTGIELENREWQKAKVVASDLKGRTYKFNATDMALATIKTAEAIFPDMVDGLKELLREPLGSPAPADRVPEPREEHDQLSLVPAAADGNGLRLV